MNIVNALKILILSSTFIFSNAYAEVLICENTPGAYVLDLDAETGRVKVKYFTGEANMTRYFKTLDRAEKINKQISETDDLNRIKELNSRLEVVNKIMKRSLEESLLDEVITNPEVVDENLLYSLEDGKGFLVQFNATVLWFNNSTLKLNIGLMPSLSIKPELQSEEVYNCKRSSF